jgi:hypothetical protein
MTAPTHPDDQPGGPQLAALAALFGPDGPPDLDELDPPVHWPTLSAGDAAAAWESLRRWVLSFQHRFATQTRLPDCWWRHNELVETLAALRDHERACYAPTAPPTAAVEFHRAFRDLEARWDTWIRRLRCAHDPSAHHRVALDLTAPAGWADWVTADTHRRGHTATHPAHG